MELHSSMRECHRRKDLLRRLAGDRLAEVRRYGGGPDLRHEAAVDDYTPPLLLKRLGRAAGCLQIRPSTPAQIPVVRLRLKRPAKEARDFRAAVEEKTARLVKTAHWDRASTATRAARSATSLRVTP